MHSPQKQPTKHQRHHLVAAIYDAMPQFVEHYETLGLDRSDVLETMQLSLAWHLINERGRVAAADVYSALGDTRVLGELSRSMDTAMQAVNKAKREAKAAEPPDLGTILEKRLADGDKQRADARRASA